MSTIEHGMVPEAWGRHAEACAKLREAEEELHAAMGKLSSATARWVMAEAEASGEMKVRALADIAASNTASWSGGATQPSNIIEARKRREALDLPRREVRREAGAPSA